MGGESYDTPPTPTVVRSRYRRRLVIAYQNMKHCGLVNRDRGNFR